MHFFKCPGLAITLKDPEQFIQHSCSLLNGEHTLDQIIDKLPPIHCEAKEHLAKLIEVLDQELLLEDAALKSHAIQLRYASNVEFFNAFCHSNIAKTNHQHQLHNKHIVILGLGGVGSNVALQLLAMGCNRFTLIDHDVVNEDNLNRQIAYTPTSVGQAKTQTFLHYANTFSPDADIECITAKVTDTQMLIPILQKADLVICAIDEPRDQVLNWVNQACVQSQTPWVCGGVDYLYLSYFSMVPGQSGCLQCWQDQARQKKPLFQTLIQNDQFVAGNKINVAIMPYIAMLTGLISNEAVKLLTRYSPPLAIGALWLFDCTTNHMHTQETWSRNADCPVCSNSAT